MYKEQGNTHAYAFFTKFAVIMLLLQLKMLSDFFFFFFRFSQCSSHLHAANDMLLSFSGRRSCVK